MAHAYMLRDGPCNELNELMHPIYGKMIDNIDNKDNILI